jgi:thiosulfate dehydrogenase [quinone] large subunit
MQARYDRNDTAFATLRIVVGIFFVLFGQYKVFGTDFTVHGGFEQWVRSFLAEGAYP